MSRATRRAGTKTKVIPGGAGKQKPPKYKWSRRTKAHPNKKGAAK